MDASLTPVHGKKFSQVFRRWEILVHFFQTRVDIELGSVFYSCIEIILTNVSQVMGPTVVGYSSSDPMAVMSESAKLKGVMKALISISADYWLVFFIIGCDEFDSRRPYLTVGFHAKVSTCFPTRKVL